MSATTLTPYTPVLSTQQNVTVGTGLNAVLIVNGSAYSLALTYGSITDTIRANTSKLYANLGSYANLPTSLSLTPSGSGSANGMVSVVTWATGNEVPSLILQRVAIPTTGGRSAAGTPYAELTINAFDFGAAGDGVTNDQPPLQAALDLLRTIGGGELYLPTGTYLTNAVQGTTTNSGLYAGLAIGSYTTLRGAGPHSTTIKLAASSPNQTYHVVNYQEAGPGGDVDITVRDIALDGNGSGQLGTVDGQYGLGVFFASRILWENVHSHDYLGTTQGGNGPNGTAGESWCFGANNCADVTMIACEAYGASGSTTVAAGFSNNYCFNLQLTDCKAHDTYHSHGMTHWNCNHVSYTGCSAWKCGGTGTIAGFNSEISNYVSYEGCMSGGLTPGAQAGTYSSGTNLGNYSYGYRILSGTFHSYNGCQSYGNPYGLYLDSTNGAISDVYLHGCLFNQGTQYGVYANSGYTVGTISIPGSNRFLNFTNGQVYLNGQTAPLNSLQFPAPSMPASGTTYNSPFPFPCAVTIYGGTVTVVTVNGTQALAGPGTVVVPRLGSITLTYSAAPTWNWYGM